MAVPANPPQAFGRISLGLKPVSKKVLIFLDSGSLSLNLLSTGADWGNDVSSYARDSTLEQHLIDIHKRRCRKTPSGFSALPTEDLYGTEGTSVRFPN